MSKKFEETLLKLRRKFSKDEAFALVNDRLKELETEFGKQKSYVAELEDKNKELEDQLQKTKEKLYGERHLSNKDLDRLKGNKWVLEQVKNQLVFEGYFDKRN